MGLTDSSHVGAGLLDLFGARAAERWPVPISFRIRQALLAHSTTVLFGEQPSRDQVGRADERLEAGARGKGDSHGYVDCMTDTVILDVDGTLVDSNYHHALAWTRAFAHFELFPPVWRIHRAVGMGGDKLVAHVAGAEAEQRLGDALRDRWTQEFDRLIGEVRPFDGTRALLEAVKNRGHHLVLASSGQRQHVETLLRLFDGQSLADAWTTADDADESKPAADLLQVALSRVGGSAGLMVGDATWDAQAAQSAGMPSVGLLTGGFSEAELLDAGAAHVFEGPAQLAQAVADGLIERLPSQSAQDL